MLRLALSLSAALTATPALATVCVENAGDESWLFVAHADDGPREIAELAPGASLCSQGDSPMGTVAVFEERTDLEGCSRRVPHGATERLIAFPHVDLCTWARSN